MDNVLTATEHAHVPWFFTDAPSPEEGVVWCAALFAATVVLAEAADVTPEVADAMVLAAAAAMAQTPEGTSPTAARDGVLVAARDALQRSTV